MKKIIVTLVVAISSLTAFAGEEVNETVLKSFNKEFAGVKEVNWTSNENYYKAEFVFNGLFVIIFITPPIAFLPYNVPCGPRTISTFSRSKSSVI